MCNAQHAAQQRRTERKIAKAVKQLHATIYAGTILPAPLADAIRIPVPVLALPANACRFWLLYNEFTRAYS